MVSSTGASGISFRKRRMISACQKVHRERHLIEDHRRTCQEPVPQRLLTGSAGILDAAFRAGRLCSPVEPPHSYVRETSTSVVHHADYLVRRDTHALCGATLENAATVPQPADADAICPDCEEKSVLYHLDWWRGQSSGGHRGTRGAARQARQSWNPPRRMRRSGLDR